MVHCGQHLPRPRPEAKGRREGTFGGPAWNSASTENKQQSRRDDPDPTVRDLTTLEGRGHGSETVGESCPEGAHSWPLLLDLRPHFLLQSEEPLWSSDLPDQG